MRTHLHQYLSNCQLAKLSHRNDTDVILKRVIPTINKHGRDRRSFMREKCLHLSNVPFKILPTTNKMEYSRRQFTKTHKSVFIFSFNRKLEHMLLFVNFETNCHSYNKNVWTVPHRTRKFQSLYQRFVGVYNRHDKGIRSVKDYAFHQGNIYSTNNKK